MLRSNYKKDTQKTTIVPANATEKTLTLAEEGAITMCGCPAMVELVALKEEYALLETKTDENSKIRKQEIKSLVQVGEIRNAFKKCLVAVNKKIKALDAEAQANFKTDFEAAFAKECPEIFEALK